MHAVNERVNQGDIFRHFLPIHFLGGGCDIGTVKEL